MYKMKNWLHYILLVAAAVMSLHAVAETEPHDTVYFYDSWEHILTQSPCTAIEDPWIDPITPYEVIIEVPDERFNNLIWDKYIAATLGDSLWLINSEYLKREFKGDAKKLDAFVPLFFNDKVAYAVYNGNFSVKDILFGMTDGEYDAGMDYYYIDFENRKVLRVTSGVLTDLLEDYHDLQMRYEGMKDYKKRHIIEDYFFKYIDRTTQDVMRPYILDIMGSDDGAIN